MKSNIEQRQIFYFSLIRRRVFRQTQTDVLTRRRISQQSFEIKRMSRSPLKMRSNIGELNCFIIIVAKLLTLQSSVGEVSNSAFIQNLFRQVLIGESQSSKVQV